MELSVFDQPRKGSAHVLDSGFFKRRNGIEPGMHNQSRSPLANRYSEQRLVGCPHRNDPVQTRLFQPVTDFDHFRKRNRWKLAETGTDQSVSRFCV